MDFYDAVANRVRRVHDGVVTTWTYDRLNRLVSQETSGANSAFSYDKVGNVLTKSEQGRSPQASSYGAADRMVTAIDEWAKSFVYDAAGNLRQVNVNGVNTYAYDGENRMTKRTDPDLRVASYTYAANGLRRSACEPGGSLTTMVWDGANYLGEVS